MKNQVGQYDGERKYDPEEESSLSPEIKEMATRLNQCGKLGKEVAEIIKILSNEAIVFTALNKEKQIGYIYACVISIQASIELLSIQKRKEKKHTIRQIQVQLLALKNFILTVQIQTFSNGKIQACSERVSIIIYSMNQPKNLKKNNFLKSMGNL